MFRSMSVLKYFFIATSLMLLFLLALGIKALFNPAFDRTSDPSVFSQQGFLIPAHAQILDAGTINTFGIYPLHKAFAVFILPKSGLASFLKEPGIKSYNPLDAKIGREHVAEAPDSLGFSSQAWRAAETTNFRAYHIDGAGGDILVDLDNSQFCKIYISMD